DEARVRFFLCDLLDGAAARGCYGIFHLASSCTVDCVLDPQKVKELVAPAVEGTLNVLRAAKDVGACAGWW
uniref:3-beta hydroxysteroid dehydrogenase/isomerase domain-containing protein n=1 Tax=Aegilops tauschii subsp. strangulata TaxID=200361 RepID=A0A453RVX4_AEGTS